MKFVFFVLKFHRCCRRIGMFAIYFSRLHLRMRRLVYSGSLCSSAVKCHSRHVSPPEWSVIHGLTSRDETRLWCQLVRCGEVRQRQRQRWRQEDEEDGTLPHERFRPPQSLSKSDTQCEPGGLEQRHEREMWWVGAKMCHTCDELFKTLCSFILVQLSMHSFLSLFSSFDVILSSQNTHVQYKQAPSQSKGPKLHKMYVSNTIASHVDGWSGRWRLFLRQCNILDPVRLFPVLFL